MQTPPDSLEFHNAHPDPREDGSWQLSRYPEAVRHSMGEGGRVKAIDSCGVEIRFVTPAPNIRLTLSCEITEAEVQVYCGPFLHSTIRLSPGVPTALHLSPPTSFPQAVESVLASGGFSPAVWRVAPGRATFRFHHIDTFGHPVRPPTAEEKPAVTWLAYGSSITHSHLGGYPFHAARLLHWNLHSKGLGGACHIEPEAVRYLANYAAENGADVITAELGVNMRNAFTVEEFTRRAGYLAETMRAANPGIPIALITAFTNSEYHPRSIRPAVERQQGFNAALRDIVAQSQDPDLHLIDGAEILSDFTLLSADLLHPTPSGHALMGHNLAARLNAMRPGDPVA